MYAGRAALLGIALAACHPDPGAVVTLTLADGTAVTGTIAHEYDRRSNILHPQERAPNVYAVLTAPGDVRLVPADTVVWTSVHGREIVPTRWAQNRAGPVTLERLPFDGAWQVHEDGRTYHAHEGGCGDFALDLDRGPNDAFGAPVTSPATGTVSIAVGDRPDHDPKTPATTGANAVFITSGAPFEIGMYHFGQGSLRIAGGARVSAGQALGVVGTSGTTYGAHLHLGVFLRGDALPKGSCHGWSVPFVFDRLYVSARTTGGVLRQAVYPRTGEWVSNAPF